MHERPSGADCFLCFDVINLASTAYTIIQQVLLQPYELSIQLLWTVPRQLYNML
jgi:hypothetical protein